jgi:translation initiation factor IF-2
MSKVRVYELARELDKDNKTLEEAIRGLGIQIKNYMSTLSPDEVTRVRAAMGAPPAARPAPRPLVTRPTVSPSAPSAPSAHSAPSAPSAHGGHSASSVPSGHDPRAPQVIRRRADVVKKRRDEEEAAEEAAAAAAAAAAATELARQAPARPFQPTPSPAMRPSLPPRPHPSTVSSPSASAPVTRSPVERPAHLSSPPPASHAGGGDSSSKEDEGRGGERGPAVGTRIELPRGTRRFATGMASRLERPAVEERPAPAPSQPTQARPSTPAPRPAEPAAPRPVSTPAPTAAPAAASAPTNAAPAPTTPPAPIVSGPGQTGPDGRSRVVRNEDGVIVGAASQRSEPKILGFIPLAASRKKQQVIITDVSEEGKQGRATQRKQREERVQAQARRRKMTRKPLGGKGMPGGRSSTAEMSDEKKRIRIDEAIQVSDLAHQMGQKASVVLRTLWGMGLRGLTINHAIDAETSEVVAAEFGYTVENVAFQEGSIVGSADAGEMEHRAPIVTIMGHVDHGKTSLLDKIREARVAAGEAGGITQHIGAYKVETPRGDVVFLDTPGHEAFTAMRSRGAQVTDIVVLVVAADDGIMPTTVEAIKHANDADVPIVVAINKIDKPEANPGRVKQALMEYGIVGEEFGGEVPIVEVSAKTGVGIDRLLEQLVLQAEVLELVAPHEGRATGVVLEARIDKGRGPVATVLLQSGMLKVGDMLVADEASGKVRGIFDDRGRKLTEAGPSTPVEVLGLDTVPAAGDPVNVVENDRDAKTLITHRREQRRRKESVRTGPSIQELLQRRKTAVVKIVLRADVQGSAQAVKQALEDLSTDKVKVEVIKAEVGQINETDVKYARAGEAVIFGFNVKTTGKAAPVAEAEGVAIHTFEVIYAATDKCRELMIGMLEPEYREKEQGEAEVRALFPIPRLGVVAGCRVTRGIIQRSSHVRVVRQGKVLFSGTIHSLRVFKDDVKEVKDGFECGIVVDGFPGVQEGDVIQAFEVEAITPSL